VASGFEDRLEARKESVGRLDRARQKRCDFQIVEKAYKVPEPDGPTTYEQIFWFTQTSMQQRRPRGVRLHSSSTPAEARVRIASDERYPWSFGGLSTERGPLPAGDYALMDGDEIVAVVERKTLKGLLSDFSQMDVLRQRLLETLVAFTEPVVAGHHAWSRFSRHALWAMATSSWASQFANVARQFGNERRGVTEVQRMLTMMPEINRAAPQLYEVQSGGVSRTCQKLGSCCLYFKISDRQFCASCPIIPESERLERNRSWVAAHQSQTRGTN